MTHGEVHFWAKTLRDARGREVPGLSVRDHCLNVGCMAEALIGVLPGRVRRLLPQGAATLAALHDVGKVSPGFQQKCEVWVRLNPWFKKDAGYESDHAKVSQRTAEQVSPGNLRSWAEALGAHHGRVQGPMLGDCGGGMWCEERTAVVRDLRRVFGEGLPKTDVVDAPEWFFAGLVTVADWLGSDVRLFSAARSRQPLEKAKQLQRAVDAVRRLRFGVTTPSARLSFEEIFARKPRPLQQAVGKVSPHPGVYIVEDQMGSGKTEAALWLACRLMAAKKARGIYFALPTRMTSDRIHRRMADFLKALYPGETVLPLVHGTSWLREKPNELSEALAAPDLRAAFSGSEQELSEARAWFASTRTGLLSPFAVGTVDQALLGIVAAKHFFVRQFALAGKVVVLDEVHSYDVYTGTLIETLVQRLRELHATVVVLSATLTARARAALLGGKPERCPAGVPYPLVSSCTAAGCTPTAVKPHARPKSVRVEMLAVEDVSDPLPIAHLAAGLADKGRCVLLIRNTVSLAQETYEKAKAACKEGTLVGLLHSRFPAFQRGSYPTQPMDVLKRHALHEEFWLRALDAEGKHRPKSCVLVATQVVEQSVDIDADVIVTDLAPTDMLLQRIGRLHRHKRPGRRGRPKVFIIVNRHLVESAETMSAAEISGAFGASARVYAPYVLLRTLREWRGLPSLRLPGDIRKLIEATYADPSGREPAAWRKWAEKLASKRQELAAQAISATNVRGRELKPDEEGVHTRHSEQPQTLLVLFKGLEPLDRGGHRVRFKLLDNAVVPEASALEYRIDLARALHRNAVKVPAWWVRSVEQAKLPPALAVYFNESVAWARLVCSNDGLRSDQQTHLLLGGVPLETPVLEYTAEIGVRLLKRSATQTLVQNDEDTVQPGD